MKKEVILVDSIGLKISKKYCKELKDSVGDLHKSLVIKVKATHGGYVNGNKYYYVVDSMSDAVKTWVSPYNKPVLIHHDEHSDPIGRVIDAEFVPISSNRKDKPKGYILLTLKITDKAAMDKILDGRYMTVSVGTLPSSAICSICDRDLLEDGPCDHKRGRTYDSSTCFWKITVKGYSEVSFVNKPADNYQTGLESVTTSDEDNSDIIFDSILEEKPEIYLEDSENTEVDESKLDINEDELIILGWLLDEMKKEGLIEDSKLSTEERKKLSSSTFCGPNRSFPINDCEHYLAAKKLLNKYKGPGDKTRILACVERRGKTLKCNTTNDEVKIETIGIKEDSVSMELKQLQDKITELTGIVDTLTKDNATLKTDKEKLEHDKKEIENQLTVKTQDIDKLNEKLIIFESDKHKSLVDKYFDLRVKLGKTDVKELIGDQVNAYKDIIVKRTTDSLIDSITDFESELVKKEQPPEPKVTVTKSSVDSKDEKGIKIVDEKNTQTENLRDLVDLCKK